MAASTTQHAGGLASQVEWTLETFCTFWDPTEAEARYPVTEIERTWDSTAAQASSLTKPKHERGRRGFQPLSHNLLLAPARAPSLFDNCIPTSITMRSRSPTPQQHPTTIPATPSLARNHECIHLQRRLSLSNHQSRTISAPTMPPARMETDPDVYMECWQSHTWRY